MNCCVKANKFSNENNFQQELFGTIFLIFTFHFWFKDLLRELVIKYEVLLIIFFLVFLLFIISEGLLFCSFFWISFHSLSSPTLRTCPPEGFYLPDPCELTFANTLLLSNAAISLGNTFISLEFYYLYRTLGLSSSKKYNLGLQRPEGRYHYLLMVLMKIRIIIFE